MGMFDYVSFTTGNTVCDAIPEEYRQDSWQTKDLYNAMYALVIENNLTYYKDRGGALHHLPLCGSFEIHNWDSEKEVSTRLQVDTAYGVVIKVGPITNAVHGAMPHVPAMDEDQQEDAEHWEETLARWQKIADERSLWDKFKINFRAARNEWREAARFLVNGFKRLFGIYKW